MTTSPDTIQKTAEALTSHNFQPIILQTKEEVLAKIEELIPAGATVMNGSSTTLEQVGYLDYVKSGQDPWENLHTAIVAEQDPEKQAQLRFEALKADYYLGSAHALTETGEILIASNTGSQLPHLVFTSKHIVLVVGAQKIVPDIASGFARIQEHVVPLEDERMKKVYGYGTTWAKTLVLHQENPSMGRTLHVLVVNEELGF